MSTLLPRALPHLALGAVALVAACGGDDDAPKAIVDLQLQGVIEQPGARSDHVVTISFHRQGVMAKRSFSFWIELLAELPEPIEFASVGALASESARDQFSPGDSERENVMGGRLELAACPGGTECTSVFSSVVTSSAPVPARVPLDLLGSANIAGELDWEKFQVELVTAPTSPEAPSP
ncbi:MAG: hypothetical protein QM778_27845 [Myxococcales bacterium]